MADIVLIQGSLRKNSHTEIVVTETAKELDARKISYEIIDLKKIDLQFCDGRKIEEYNQDMQKAYKQIESAKAIIFGMPVYCWSISGVLKNFFDIISAATQDKVAGILCNAGSKMSYLASADLMKVLSYEASVTTVQPIVKTSSEHFKDGVLVDEKAKSKISAMLDELCKLLK